VACLCTAITRDVQEERAFLEQEHDDRANILATRVVTTGGVMQIFGGCNDKGRWEAAVHLKSSPIMVKEKDGIIIWRLWNNGMEQGELMEDVVSSAAVGPSTKLEESFLALRSDWNSIISPEQRYRF
jgi:hypothetical protein